MINGARISSAPCSILRYPIVCCLNKSDTIFQKETKGGNSMIPKTRKIRYKFGIEIGADVVSNQGKFYFYLHYMGWRTASHVPCVEGSGPPYLVFYDRGHCAIKQDSCLSDHTAYTCDVLRSVVNFVEIIMSCAPCSLTQWSSATFCSSRQFSWILRFE